MGTHLRMVGQQAKPAVGSAGGERLQTRQDPGIEIVECQSDSKFGEHASIVDAAGLEQE